MCNLPLRCMPSYMGTSSKWVTCAAPFPSAHEPKLASLSVCSTTFCPLRRSKTCIRIESVAHGTCGRRGYSGLLASIGKVSMAF